MNRHAILPFAFLLILLGCGGRSPSSRPESRDAIEPLDAESKVATFADTLGTHELSSEEPTSHSKLSPTPNSGVAFRIRNVDAASTLIGLHGEFRPANAVSMATFTAYSEWTPEGRYDAVTTFGIGSFAVTGLDIAPSEVHQFVLKLDSPLREKVEIRFRGTFQ